MGEGACIRAGVQGAAPPACRNIEQVADGSGGTSSTQYLLGAAGTGQYTIDGHLEPLLEHGITDNESLSEPIGTDANSTPQLELFNPQLEIPSYIRVCQERRHTGEGGWSLRLTNRSSGETIFVPYSCGSWRCEGECRTRYRQMEYVRIRNALCGRRPETIYFAVLTVDEQREKSIEEQYAKLETVWPKLRKTMRYMFGAYDYVMTLEEHRSGHPHANVIVVSDSPLMAAMEADGTLENWFKGAAARSGWGWRASFERAHNAEAVAAYVSKVAVGEVIGEVTKDTQLPWHAPKGKRRLRSSRGFLEPRRKSGEWTGSLHFCPAETIERATFVEFDFAADILEKIQAIRLALRENPNAPLVCTEKPPRALLMDSGGLSVAIDTS